MITTNPNSQHSNQPQIMLSAGEASGDMHAANLVRALRAKDPGLHFYGMGAREMQRAGVELLHDASNLAVVGLTEIFSHLGAIFRARSLLLQRLRQQPPALLILIDYPEFNLLLASAAKRLGIPILYYISPQIWAWRSGRVHRIGKLADRIAVILPFEQSFYAQHGYQAHFVGHPLLDLVRAEESAAAFRLRHHIGPEQKLVGLVPGSRAKEVSALLPIFLDAALHLERARPGRYVFLLPQAPTISRQLLDEHGLNRVQGQLELRVLQDDRYSLMAACDAALAASGTVLLELAMLSSPMVAAYRVSAHTYFLGKLLVRGVRFFSLVNLIAGRKIIPELLQQEVTAPRLVEALLPLLDNTKEREAMLRGFAQVRQALGTSGAAEKTAELALTLIRNAENKQLSFLR